MAVTSCWNVNGNELTCGPENGGVVMLPHINTIYIVPEEHWETCKGPYWDGYKATINDDTNVENAPDWVINRLKGVVDVGLNYSVIGKCSPDKLSEHWETTTVTIEQLATHISKGYPWMPGLLNGGRRLQKNVIGADVLAIDIDNGCDISQAWAHPFIKNHACLGIESTNSGVVSAKNLDGHDKFRVVFRLHRPCEDWKTIRICNQYLRLQIDIDGEFVADKSCKDASRFFFGAEGRKPFLFNPDVCLPASFIDDAMAWYGTNKRTTSASGVIDGGAVTEALKHIPPYIPGNDTYNMYVPLAAGVVNDLGEIGAELLRQWDAGRGDWSPRTFNEWLTSVVESETDTPASIGTLFYWAHQYGYKADIKDKRLSDKHKKFLEDQGIIPVEGLCSVESVAGINLPGLLFPYGDTGYFRLRVDWDDVDPDVIERWTRDGELPEYVSPWGVKEHPYNPFGCEGDCVITTGEINVLALNQNGIPAIGLAREWGWKDNPNWSLSDKHTMLVSSDCYKYPVLGHAYGGLAMSAIEPRYKELCEEHGTKEAIKLIADEYYNSFKFTLLSNELEDGDVNGAASYIKRHGRDAIKEIIDKALPLIRFDGGPTSAFTTEPAGDNSKKLPAYACRELIRVIVAQTLKTTRVHVPGVNDYRYDPLTGLWVPMDKGEFANLAHELSRRNHWNNKSAKLLNECLNELKAVAKVRPGDMDNPRYICFTNGVLDTNSKKLLPHHPKYRLTKRLGFAYNPLALWPNWETFIAQTFEGSSFTQTLVRAMFRWVLAPKKNEKFKCEAIFQLQGAPGMGKGTLLDVLIGLLGEDSYAIFDSTSLESKEGRYDYLSKQALIHPDYKGHFSSQAVASLNAIASNEPVSMRSLYKNGAKARLGAVVVMAFNETPRISQDSKDGFARRNVLIKFRNPPKVKDRGLSETLTAELSGIFNWAWGMEESVAIDIIDSSRLHVEFTEDREETLAEQNTVYGWLIENVVDGYPEGVNLTGIYQCYLKWCNECGIRNPLGRTNFGKELKRAGATVIIDKQSKKKHYCIPPADKLDVEALLGLSTPCS